MAMSRKQALDAARNILNGPRAAESTRLDRLAKAMQPLGLNDAPRVEVPKGAPDIMQRLARKASTNFIPLVVDVFSQVMKVDDYYTTAEGRSPWEFWQRNGMDARQTGVHRAALQYGASYLTVLPGDRGPVMRGVSPRAMTAVYANPADDDWPMLALHVDGSMWRLYDEEQVYFFGVENQPRGPLATTDTLALGNGTRLTYLESREHGAGVCPVIRFRDRMLLDGEEQFGIVEPLLTIQERIDETTFGMLVAQYYSAFKQRYVIGWVPQDELDVLQASAADVWTFEDDDVKVGQFTETDLTRYIDSKASAIRDLSAIGQVPAQNLGVDGISNISDATLAGLETGKDRKADEITTSFGESWEQSLRLGAAYEGLSAAADDYRSEVRWKDSTARSFAQTVDGLGKLVTMLGVPEEMAFEMIPGWTNTMVQRAKELKAASNPLRGDVA